MKDDTEVEVRIIERPDGLYKQKIIKKKGQLVKQTIQTRSTLYSVIPACLLREVSNVG